MNIQKLSQKSFIFLRMIQRVRLLLILNNSINKCFSSNKEEEEEKKDIKRTKSAFTCSRIQTSNYVSRFNDRVEKNWPVLVRRNLSRFRGIVNFRGWDTSLGRSTVFEPRDYLRLFLCSSSSSRIDD